jgi:hypothetical protein
MDLLDAVVRFWALDIVEFLRLYATRKSLHSCVVGLRITIQGLKDSFLIDGQETWYAIYISSRWLLNGWKRLTEPNESYESLSIVDEQLICAIFGHNYVDLAWSMANLPACRRYLAILFDHAMTINGSTRSAERLKELSGPYLDELEVRRDIYTPPIYSAENLTDAWWDRLNVADQIVFIQRVFVIQSNVTLEWLVGRKLREETIETLSIDPSLVFIQLKLGADKSYTGIRAKIVSLSEQWNSIIAQEMARYLTGTANS